MDKNWIQQKAAAYISEIEKVEQAILTEVEKQDLLPAEKREKIRAAFQKNRQEHYAGLGGPASSTVKYTLSFKERKGQKYIDAFLEYQEWLKNLPLLKYERLYTKIQSLQELEDSEPFFFDGDIVITDPCYLIPEENSDQSGRPKWSDFHAYSSIGDYPDFDEERRFSRQFEKESEKLRKAEEAWEKAHPSDWEKCEYGSRMDKLGFSKYIVRDTIYGDWSCTVFDQDTKQKLGQFCADAGMVGVFLLNDIRSYNPKFSLKKPRGLAACIRNFRGTIQAVVRCVNETHEEYTVEIVGNGINTKTDKPFRFISKQDYF